MDKNRIHNPDDPSKRIVRSKSLEDLSKDPSKKIGRSKSFDAYWSSKRLREEEIVRHSLTDEDINVRRGRQLGGESQRRTESLDKFREVPDDSSQLSRWLEDKKEAIEEASEHQGKITEEKLEKSKCLDEVELGLDRMYESLKQLKAKYEEYKKLGALAEDEIAKARVKCNDLREQISKEEQDEEERQTKLPEEKEKETKTSNDLERLREQLKTQERELGEMVKRKEDLQKSIEVEREKLKEMSPGNLGVDEYRKKIETLLRELETLRKEKSDLELEEIRNESEFYDLDKSKKDIKVKKEAKEEKESKLLELQRNMVNSIGIKEKCEEIIGKLIDEEYLRKLSESDRYEDCLEKIYIIGVLQPRNSTITYDLQALLLKEDTNLVYQEDRKKLLDNSSALYGSASTIVDMYNLRTELRSRLEAKQKESTNMPKFEIEDIRAYDNLKVECCRIAETGQNPEVVRDYNAEAEVLVNSKDNYELVRGHPAEKKYKGMARAFIDLSLKKFIEASKAAKMLESMIEYNEAENSRILSRISLPEGGSVKQRINTLFEQEILQNRDLEVRRGELLDLFSKYVEGEKSRIEYIKGEEEIIRSFLEENKKPINIVEGEIDEKINRRKEIKRDLEIKERKIVGLEYEQQTSQTDMKAREKEIQDLESQIKDQEKPIRALDRQYQESEAHCQKRQSEIEMTRQQIREMDSDLQQARGRIASIEAKCKGHTQTMRKLYRELQAHRRERHNALNDKRCYNQRIEWIELLCQHIRHIEGQREKLLASIKPLEDNYDELQKRKRDIEGLSFDDHQGRSELGIEPV